MKQDKTHGFKLDFDFEKATAEYCKHFGVNAENVRDILMCIDSLNTAGIKALYNTAVYFTETDAYTNVDRE